MKVQDILFLIILLAMVVFAKKRPRMFVWAGLLCLTLSMPFFHFWVFFTAERLVWYAGAFLFIAILLMLKKK